MDTPTLETQTREAGVKANQLRAQKLIPIVYYGKKKENLHLVCDYETFRKLYRTAGDNTVINLLIDGKDKVNVLVHDVQVDPVYDRYTHIDFINVNMDEEVTTNVPVVLEGTAPVVKEQGGTLVQNLHEVEVKCLPMNIPQEIKGNVDGLVDFHTSLHVSDLVIPENVNVTNEPGQTVATVTAIQEEKEPEAVVEGEAGEEGAAPAEGGEENKEEGAKEE